MDVCLLVLCLCVYVCIWCQWAYVCGGQWSISGVFLNWFLFTSWDSVSHWTWSWPIQLDWKASKPQASSCLSVPARALGMWHSAWRFTCVCRIWTQALPLVYQVPYPLFHPPSKYPFSAFFKKVRSHAGLQPHWHGTPLLKTCWPRTPDQPPEC